MAHSLYITGTEGSSGKTVVTLGLMHFLQTQVRKVAFFRPIIDSEDEARRDSSINLILKHFELDMLYRDTYACTYKEALELVTSGNMSLLIEKIFQKYKALENEYDFVLCQGTDFRDKDTAVQFELNSEIAASLNIPLALVINGKDKSLDAIQASVRSNLELLRTSGAKWVACSSTAYRSPPKTAPPVRARSLKAPELSLRCSSSAKPPPCAIRASVKSRNG